MKRRPRPRRPRLDRRPSESIQEWLGRGNAVTVVPAEPPYPGSQYEATHIRSRVMRAAILL